jgi:hypothetical protein
MSMNRHPLATVPLAMCLWLAVGCAAIRTEAPAPQAAAVGRVAVIDTTEGFILAEFPTGRMMIGLDKREMGHYVNGGEIRIDSFGRPLFN